jgi:AcrR family transcriptional regulator
LSVSYQISLTLTRDIVRIMSMKTKKTRSRVYGGIKANLRQAERRKKLIEAGLEAFGTKGYAKTNIKMICGIAGLTERYFYESFRHKEDLLRVVYRELNDEGQRDAMAALEDNEGTPVDAAARVLRMFYQRFYQDPRRAQIQLFEILGVSKNIDREYQNAMRLLADLVRLFLYKVFPRIHEEKLSRSIIPTGLAGSIIMIAHEWVLNGFVTPLDDIISECMDLFMAMGKHLNKKSGSRSERA